MFANGEAAMGCGDWVIQVTPRRGFNSPECGGSGCVLEHDDMVWYFTRDLKATSEAAVSLIKSTNCCECVPKKWRDELSFWRENQLTGQLERKWVGPVTGVQENGPEGVLTIFAADRSVWNLSEHCLPFGVSGNELAIARFEHLWKLTDQADPSGLELVVHGDGDGVISSKDAERFASLTAEFEYLCGLGVAWTVIDDQLHFGDLSDTLSQFVIDPAVHWELDTAGRFGAVITDSGASSVTNLIVTSGDKQVMYPAELVVDPCEGLHMRKIAAPNGLSDDQLLLYATIQYRQMRRAQGPSIQTVDGSSVSEDWPIPMCDMFPGGLVTVGTARDSGICLDTQEQSTLTRMVVEGIGTEEVAVKASIAPQFAAEVSV